MKTVKPGIRRKLNGKYLATKSIDSKRYYKECDTLTEAMSWKNKFHPLLSPVIEAPRNIPTVPDQSNGRDFQITFKAVVERYRNGRMKDCSEGRIYKKGKRIDRFMPPLYSVRMCEMNPEIITRHIESEKLLANDTFGRCSFDMEIRDLTSIFNWYKEEVDFTFISPVTRYHKRVGKIRDPEKKSKYLSETQLLAFTDELPEPFKSMAMIQYCLALRIGEVAGINTGTVDFEKGTIAITDVITWLKNSPKYKPSTKTGDETTFEMNAVITSRLKYLDKLRPKGCKFFFHHKGGPIRYDIILEAYNDALERAGLSDEFSGTHIIRYTMGKDARRSHGKDAAQAIMRHKSSRMTEHYARLDVNEKSSQVVIDAGEMFRSRATIATSERESVESSAI